RGKVAGRRPERAAVGGVAVAEYVGLHRREGADAGGIRGAVAGGGVRPGRGAAHADAAGRGAGGQVVRRHSDRQSLPSVSGYHEKWNQLPPRTTLMKTVQAVYEN